MFNWLIFIEQKEHFVFATYYFYDIDEVNVFNANVD